MIARAGAVSSVRLCTPFSLPEPELTRFLRHARSISESGGFRQGPHERTVRELLRTRLSVPDEAVLLTTRSGTDALVTALALAGVRAGRRVAVPVLAYHAVAAAVTRAGALPVWVDCDESSWNVSVETLSAVLDRTDVAAVIAVDNLGTPCDLAGISRICRDRGIPLIVDACESLRPWQDEPGAAEVLYVWSFSLTKPIHAYGMGGALAVPPELAPDSADRTRLLVSQSRLPEVNAAYLVLALPHADAATARLDAIYAAYRSSFSRHEWKAQDEPWGPSSRIHAGFCLRDTEERDALAEGLPLLGIEVRLQFPLQSRFFDGAEPVRFPTATELEKRLLSFPAGAHMSDAEVETVVSRVETLVSERRVES